MTTVLKHIWSALFYLPKVEVKSIVDHHTKRSSASPLDSPEEPQKDPIGSFRIIFDLSMAIQFSGSPLAFVDQFDCECR